MNIVLHGEPRTTNTTNHVYKNTARSQIISVADWRNEKRSFTIAASLRVAYEVDLGFPLGLAGRAAKTRSGICHTSPVFHFFGPADRCLLPRKDGGFASFNGCWYACADDKFARSWKRTLGALLLAPNMKAGLTLFICHNYRRRHAANRMGGKPGTFKCARADL
jgi:hypothetical protein